MQPQKVSRGIFKGSELQTHMQTQTSVLQVAKLCAMATKLIMERHCTIFDKSLSRTVVTAGSQVSLPGITAHFFLCRVAARRYHGDYNCPALPAQCPTGWSMEVPGHEDHKSMSLVESRPPKHQSDPGWAIKQLCYYCV